MNIIPFGKDANGNGRYEEDEINSFYRETWYEYNESEHYHTFGKADKDFICKHCGTVVRKKEEDILKGNDDPLFCPKCHSPRLRYHMDYIT